MGKVRAILRVRVQQVGKNDEEATVEESDCHLSLFLAFLGGLNPPD